MSTASDLISQGIAAYQAGNRVHARRLLAQALEENPNNQSAWLWLSGVVDSPDACVYCLRRVLDINPDNDIAVHARNGLAHMQAQAIQESMQPEQAQAKHTQQTDDLAMGTGEQAPEEDNVSILAPVANETKGDEHSSPPTVANETKGDAGVLSSSLPADVEREAGGEEQSLSSSEHSLSEHSLARSSSTTISRDTRHTAPHAAPQDKPIYDYDHEPAATNGYSIIEPQQWTTTTHNVTVVEQAQSTQSAVEILYYNSLDGSDDVDVAENLFYVQQVGMRLKQIKILLYGGEVIIEAGALQFMKGSITADSTVGGVGGFAKKLASNVLTRESTFRPLYRGIGEMYLEPSFGHFIIIYLNDEEMVVDKGMFYAAESSINVGIAMQKNISSALFGGEGLFQTKLTGTGWCVLSSPVPSHEIVRYQLNNEHLLVDGDFTLLRKGNIEFRVSRSTKSFIGALTSGEGLLQTFFGTGEVWIAPTYDVYKRIKLMGFSDLTVGSNGKRQRKQHRREQTNNSS